MRPAAVGLSGPKPPVRAGHPKHVERVRVYLAQPWLDQLLVDAKGPQAPLRELTVLLRLRELSRHLLLAGPA